jgi:hypothetical protein
MHPFYRPPTAPFLILCAVALVLVGCASGGASSSAPTAPPPHIDLTDPSTMPERVTLPLTRRGNYLFAPSHVNGRTTGDMLIDTGSTLTLIDTGSANRLQLPVVGEGETLGIAGRASFEFRRAESVTLAGVGVDHNRLAALSMRKLAGGGNLALGGIAGFTAFAGHPFTLDFPNQTLTVYRRDAFTPPPDAERHDLLSFHGLPAVVATLGGGQDVLLIIDSGANNAISLPDYCKDWPRILATRASSAGQSHGVGGAIQTHQGWLRRVRVFGLQLDGVPVTFEPQPTGFISNRYVIGRIGTLALAAFQLTFDLQNRSVWITFHPEAEE